MGKRKKARRKKAILSKLHPDTCFCGNVSRSLSDDFVGYSKPTHGVYDYYKTGRTKRYPIRKCSICGKEYVDAPATA